MLRIELDQMSASLNVTSYKVNNNDHDSFLLEDGKSIWIEHRGNEK